MAFCSKCGKELEPGTAFCPACGAPQGNQGDSENIPITDFTADKPSGQLNVGMLVWSIINLLACCTPLGIVGLIFTVIATSAKTATEEANKIRTAKTCNLIGTIVGAASVLIYILFYVLIALVGLSLY